MFGPSPVTGVQDSLVQGAECEHRMPIAQNAHRQSCAGSGRQQAPPCVSEHGDDLRALDAWKPLQEIVRARALFENLEAGAHRNPGAREHAGSSDAAGNAFNGGASRPVHRFDSTLFRGLRPVPHVPVSRRAVDISP